ncbi:transmembrane protein, partial [Cystoisospora suis]
MYVCMLNLDRRLSRDLEASTCRLRWIVQEVEIFFRGDQQTGQGVLIFPDRIQVSGRLAKHEEPLHRAAEVDSNTLLIIEGTLWLKGYPRLHAKMLAAALYVAKRLRYSGLTWMEFFEYVSPQDLEFANAFLQKESDVKLSTELKNLDKKTLYTFDFSIGNIWTILINAFETALVPLTHHALLSADFNLILGTSLLLEAYRNIQRRATGLTRWYSTFQDILRREWRDLSEDDLIKKMHKRRKEEKSLQEISDHMMDLDSHSTASERF